MAFCMHATWVRHTLVAAAVTLVSGCASSPNTTVYKAGQTNQMITAQLGEVVAVHDVVIQASSSQSGSAGTGASIGSALGGSILGDPVTAVAGAAGRAVGSSLGAGADNQRGEEITVTLRDGRTVLIVQEKGAIPFAVGDRVKIMTGSGMMAESRVVRDEDAIPGRVAR
jgi:outer membrane lipoprotein SlyB